MRIAHFSSCEAPPKVASTTNQGQVPENIAEKANQVLELCKDLDYYQLKGVLDVVLTLKQQQPNRTSDNTSQIKSHCLTKAIEVFKYSQTIPVLELAKQFESYITTGSAD